MGQRPGQPPYQPPAGNQPPGPPQGGYPPHYQYQQPPAQGGYPPQYQYQQPPPQLPPKKRRGCFKWVAIEVGALILIGVIIAVANGGGNKKATVTPGAAFTPVASNATAATTQSASTAAPTAAAARNAATATSAATATNPARAKVGDKVAVKGMTVTVNEVRDPAQPTTISTPKQGNRFVAVDVTIENTDTKPASYNALYATVKDTAGRQYDTTFTDVVNPALSAGNNSPGDKIRGWVVFEVPTDAKLATFKYEPLGGSQAVVDIAK